MKRHGMVDQLFPLVYAHMAGEYHMTATNARGIASLGDDHQRCQDRQQGFDRTNYLASELDTFLQVFDDFGLFTIDYKKTNALFMLLRK